MSAMKRLLECSHPIVDITGPVVCTECGATLATTFDFYMRFIRGGTRFVSRGARR